MRWHVAQVAGFVRGGATWLWAAACLLRCVISRTAYDWRSRPTTDFAPALSGAVDLDRRRDAAIDWHAGRLALALVRRGVSSNRRCVASQIAAVSQRRRRGRILLGVWHDRRDAERRSPGSGGLAEVFVLPFMMIIPGIVGAIGSAAGSAGRKVRSALVG